ncbi:MAG: LysM peptidoglycan-binding domain-containing protein [Planctomycetia bacterium]
MRFIGTVQFLLGLAMLIAGVGVVAPLAAEWYAAHGQAALVHPTADVATTAPPTSLPAQYGHAIPDPRGAAAGDMRDDGMSSPAFAPHAEPSYAAPQMVAPYQPPSAPSRMPAAFPGVVQNAPGLTPTYRSTLDIPPPPLLDAHGPPPVAPGWTAREPQPAAITTSEMKPLPATYTIRDGDDLTSLAIRLYGHPGAAAAILAANRDRLADPAILPIGVRLRLPPPWAVTSGGHAAGPHMIEPGAGTGLEPRGRSPFAPASASRAWLSTDGAAAAP